MKKNQHKNRDGNLICTYNEITSSSPIPELKQQITTETSTPLNETLPSKKDTLQNLQPGSQTRRYNMRGSNADLRKDTGLLPPHYTRRYIIKVHIITEDNRGCFLLSNWFWRDKHAGSSYSSVDLIKRFNPSHL